MKISKLIAAAAIALGLAHTANAATEGKDYEVLPQSIPQLQENKIEVLEFFGYFCPHCENFEPHLQRLSKSFAGDTYLRTEHVVWDEGRDFGLARLAAAVNSAKAGKQANTLIFHAFQKGGVALNQAETAREWLKAQTAFNGKKVLAAYDSFGNQAQAQKMADLTRTHNITGTPTLIVGGKYKVILQGQDPLQTINELIVKVRSERGMKAPAPKAAVKSKGISFAEKAAH